jgi:fumarate hydratase subunit beta
MESVFQISSPFTKEDFRNLRIGDTFEFSGNIYTARDASHKRLHDALEKGCDIPIDLTNQFIFYAGPCPAKPGRIIGPIAPTTSMRMDSFVEMVFRLGVVGTIGKGERSGFVSELCKKYGGVYLLSIGGASALISNHIKSCEVVAYDDLGTESIKKLRVENLRLIVGIDTQGRSFHENQVNKYKR